MRLDEIKRTQKKNKNRELTATKEPEESSQSNSIDDHPLKDSGMYNLMLPDHDDLWMFYHLSKGLANLNNLNPDPIGNKPTVSFSDPVTFERTKSYFKKYGINFKEFLPHEQSKTNTSVLGNSTHNYVLECTNASQKNFLRFMNSFARKVNENK